MCTFCGTCPAYADDQPARCCLLSNQDWQRTVREWLKGLAKEERKIVGEDIAYVQFKWPIGKPRVDHLRGAIWEVSRSGGMAKRNPRTGSRFDDFLKEEGIFDEVQAKALKRALTEQLEESMHDANLSKLQMARKMATSRSQLDRVLDPENVSIQLDTLIKAARAVGKQVEIRIKRAHRKAA
jgi:hypothetical protein